LVKTQIGKKALTSALVLLLLLSFSLQLATTNAQEPYENLTVQEANQMIHHNDFALIIDVRNISEYALGHLYNAINMPLATIGNRTAELQTYINSSILVYCGVGGRSASASQILVDHNFTNVYNMLGGITAWMQAGYKIYTSYNYISADYDREEEKAIIDIQPFLLARALHNLVHLFGKQC